MTDSLATATTSALARIAAALRAWWHDWMASQLEAGSHTFQQPVEPMRGRPDTHSRPDWPCY